MSKICSDHFGVGNSSLTLWELVDPGTTAQAAIELYGTNAATAAAWCALTAHFDAREDDYRFWCRVFSDLANNRQDRADQCATAFIR